MAPKGDAERLPCCALTCCASDGEGSANERPWSDGDECDDGADTSRNRGRCARGLPLLPLLPLPGACKGKECDMDEAVGVEHDRADMYPARAEGVAVSMGWMDGSMEDAAAAFAESPLPLPLPLPLLLPLRPRGTGGDTDNECELSEEEAEEGAGEAEDSIMEASFDGSRYGAK